MRVNLQAFGDSLTINPRSHDPRSPDTVYTCIEIDVADATRIRAWLNKVFPACYYCSKDCSASYERFERVAVCRDFDTDQVVSTDVIGSGVRCEPPCADALAAAGELLEAIEPNPDAAACLEGAYQAGRHEGDVRGTKDWPGYKAKLLAKLAKGD